jgi:hypothetical protein
MKNYLLIPFLLLAMCWPVFAGQVIFLGKKAAGGPCTPLSVSVSKSNYAGTGGGTSLIPDLGASPSSGNLLYLIVSIEGDSGSITTPSGWTLIQSSTGGAVSGAVFYKTAAGTEQTVTISWTNSSTSRAWYAEFSGISSPTLEASAENETYISTSSQSCSSGTTGTLSTSCCYAIAGFAVETGYGYNDDQSYTNSFVGQIYHSGTSARAAFAVALKTISATTAVTTTLSTTDTGAEIYGTVAIFKSGS